MPNKALTATVCYSGNLRTEATHLRSGNTITTDAPVDNHGKGEAFSPTDLVAVALASCMLTIMAMKADSMGIATQGVRADISKIMSKPPRRIAEIIVDIIMPPELSLSAKDKKILESAALACPVHASLHPDTKQIIRFHYSS